MDSRKNRRVYLLRQGLIVTQNESATRALLDATAQARDEMQDAMIKASGDFLKKLAAHGMAVFVPQPASPQWAAWQAALKPFKEQAEKQYPATLVRLVTDR